MPSYVYLFVLLRPFLLLQQDKAFPIFRRSAPAAKAEMTLHTAVFDLEKHQLTIYHGNPKLMLVAVKLRLPGRGKAEMQSQQRSDGVSTETGLYREGVCEADKWDVNDGRWTCLEDEE